MLAEHRRGHGAMYDALNHGRVDPQRLRRALAALPLPRAADGRIVLAVDVSPWLRPDAPTSADRLFCHVYGRGQGQRAADPGLALLVRRRAGDRAAPRGPRCWTRSGSARPTTPPRSPPPSSATSIDRLITAGQWQPGDPDIVIVADAGYDVTRLAYVLADLPVELVGRLRSDRVLRLPKPPRAARDDRPPAQARPGDRPGQARPPGPTPQHTTSTDTTRYGTAVATSWDRVHPRLTHRGCWLDHDGELPVIEGTLIRLQVEHLPGDRDPKPVWLWSSTTGATPADVDRWWQAFLRRFDLEHTFRLFKQTLGWTAPKIRTPAAADRWTWLIIAAHTQLRLARPLAADLRRPWERPAGPGRLTPARVRRGFRNIRPTTLLPARAPKPSRPGPGRPPGSRNRHPATSHDVGKTVKRDRTITARQQRTG